MQAPGVEDRRHYVVRRVAGRGAGPTRSLFGAWGAGRAGGVDPCVCSLAADLIERAALGYGEAITQIISDQLSLLVHGRWLPPGHGAPPWCPRISSRCYPCLWTQLLPMSPDCTDQPSNQALQP